MHKKRWAAFVLAAALALTGCSAGSFLHFGKGSGGFRRTVGGKNVRLKRYIEIFQHPAGTFYNRPVTVRTHDDGNLFTVRHVTDPPSKNKSAVYTGTLRLYKAIMLIIHRMKNTAAQTDREWSEKIRVMHKVALHPLMYGWIPRRAVYRITHKTPVRKISVIKV